MAPHPFEKDVARVCDLIASTSNGAPRSIIGIAGPPGSGKSTLAEAVVQTLNASNPARIPHAALLPMDGYHLDNSLLEKRGLLARKGAPETFDAAGFCDAVRSLAATNRTILFPKFDRNLDLSIANAIAIQPETPVIVVEGNYLLLNSDPWRSLANVFAATVFLSPPVDVLRRRLLQRWADHGLDPNAARQRAEGNDLPNAELVLRDRRDADLTLTQS